MTVGNWRSRARIIQLQCAHWLELYRRHSRNRVVAIRLTKLSGHQPTDRPTCARFHCDNCMCIYSGNERTIHHSELCASALVLCRCVHALNYEAYNHEFQFVLSIIAFCANRMTVDAAFDGVRGIGFPTECDVYSMCCYIFYFRCRANSVPVLNLFR